MDIKNLNFFSENRPKGQLRTGDLHSGLRDRLTLFTYKDLNFYEIKNCFRSLFNLLMKVCKSTLTIISNFQALKFLT